MEIVSDFEGTCDEYLWKNTASLSMTNNFINNKQGIERPVTAGPTHSAPVVSFIRKSKNYALVEI